jgi:hypothetical protein
MRLRIAAIAATLLTLGVAAPAVAAPTCADMMGIANHGQHIIGDYVTGVGHADLEWPPAGQVGGGGGVAVKGGPGPGFHFTIDGLAPGASFCTDRAPFTTPKKFSS